MAVGLANKAAQTIEKAMKVAIEQRYPGHQYLSFTPID
jgi:hypothetical protein